MANSSGLKNNAMVNGPSIARMGVMKWVVNGTSVTMDTRLSTIEPVIHLKIVRMEKMKCSVLSRRILTMNIRECCLL